MLVTQIAGPKPTIVLVHGAFANASAWEPIISVLQHKGYPVAAVQDPMSSLADDIATTKRVLEKINGPIVLVGHSYGGAVISGAATSNVKALVFVSAFAPDEGETLVSIQKPFAAPALGSALVADSGGYVTIDPAKFHAVFCPDLPEARAKVMAVTQGPISGTIFGELCPAPAWKNIPSWCVFGRQDQAINPDVERFCAKRMGAKVVEADGSHVLFLSKPQVVIDVILDAAQTVAKSSN
jgi:pimeloyl-ACP methyl ester carboxylesterase